MNTKRLLNSQKEACAQIDCGTTKLYEILAAGEILAIQVGGQTKIPQSEIDRFIASRPLINLQREQGLGETFADAVAKRDGVA
jgi:excisionase family DNA binding protein